MSELRAVLAESFHTHNEETLITEIYKLQAENKALKKDNDHRALAKSRDELLEVIETLQDMLSWPDYESFDNEMNEVDKIIIRAQALKEKERK